MWVDTNCGDVKLLNGILKIAFEIYWRLIEDIMDISTDVKFLICEVNVEVLMSYCGLTRLNFWAF